MGQSIYKALAMSDLGLSSKIFFANSEPIAAGRYFNSANATIVGTPIFPLAADPIYAEFLERFIDIYDVDIVFPGTQHELEKVSLLRDKKPIIATLPSRFAHLCTDKVATCKSLERYGIALPLTCDLDAYLKVRPFVGPVIVKPNHSSSSRRIFRFANFNEVEEAISSKVINSDGMLVQQRLIGDEFTSGAYIDKYTKEIQILTFKRTLTPDGATGYGEIFHSPEITEYVEDICLAFIDMGLDFGHMNVQFILTTEGPVLFEINGRLSSTEAPKAHFGFNSCAAYVANIVHQKPYTDWRQKRTGRFLRYYEEIYF